MRIQASATRPFHYVQPSPPPPTITTIATATTTTASSSYSARRARKRAYVLVPGDVVPTAAASRNDELLFSAGGLQVDRQRAKWALLDRHAALPACVRVAFANALFDEPLGELDFGRVSQRVRASTGYAASSQSLVAERRLRAYSIYFCRRHVCQTTII